MEVSTGRITSNQITLSKAAIDNRAGLIKLLPGGKLDFYIAVSFVCYFSCDGHALVLVNGVEGGVWLRIPGLRRMPYSSQAIGIDWEMDGLTLSQTERCERVMQRSMPSPVSVWKGWSPMPR